MSDEEEFGFDGTEEDEDVPDAFTPWAEKDEVFVPSAIQRVIGPDGLPQVVQADNLDQALAPSYSPVDFVCARDESQWVVRDQTSLEVIGTVKVGVTPEVQTGGVYVKRPVYTVAAKDVAWTEEALQQRRRYAVLPIPTVHPDAADLERINVEPVRWECEFLMEKLEPLSSHERAAGYNQGRLQRYCMVHTSTKGSPLQMSDESLLACSQRRPYDVASSELIVKFNRSLAARSGENRTYHPMYRAAPGAPPPAEPALPLFNELTSTLIANEGTESK